jgi:hypothetical protein
MENMQSMTTWEKAERGREKKKKQQQQRSRILQEYENKYPAHLNMAM